MNTSYLYHSQKWGARRGLSLLLLLALSIAAKAQDTYLNERITNSSSDVIGTARYVGMGGALGALGADMSVISWNPAGIGLYRKNDIALTFGGTWGKSSIDEVNRGKGTFDQAGFVFNMKTGSETCPYINFAFNYQKKINFNHNFYADNGDLGGLSQMDQVAGLTDYVTDNNTTLAGLAKDNDFFKADGQYLYNEIRSSNNTYTHHSEGSLQSFDFNLSTNVNNRAFLGLTVGVDNMRYSGWNSYWEFLNGEYNHDVYNDVRITGTGINVKLGAIIRPIEDSPFRFGFAVETPTWYRLRNSTVMNLNDLYRDGVESYLKFTLRSPWKVRASLGSTIGSSFAWDVDYEYAAYNKSSMGYPGNDDYYYGTIHDGYKDVAMNRHTRDNLRGTHTLRVGLEANATKNLSFRLGYNLSTSAYKKDISFDQLRIADDGCTAMRDYATNTNYMRLGNTNIITLGMGYHYKKFYVDLAYKVRNQKADFYAFDTSFTTNDPVYQRNVASIYDDLSQTIDPVNVDLTRHTITCTLGFKF